MKQPLLLCLFCSVVLSSMPSGCATPAAPGISGAWKPVNHFDPVPEEIPLYPAYVFYAAPTDRTLRAMLQRWAEDSKMTLRYRHPSDFTLYDAVSRIRTSDAHQAIAMLTSLYAAQRVVVSIEGDTLLVARRDDGSTPAATSPHPGELGVRHVSTGSTKTVQP